MPMLAGDKGGAERIAREELGPPGTAARREARRMPPARKFAAAAASFATDASGCPECAALWRAHPVAARDHLV
jgi:hypothetical protein